MENSCIVHAEKTTSYSIAQMLQKIQKKKS